MTLGKTSVNVLISTALIHERSTCCWQRFVDLCVSEFLFKQFKACRAAQDITAMGIRASYGITQFYLPPDTGDVPAITPAETGTRFIDPRGMKGWVDPVPTVVRLEPRFSALVREMYEAMTLTTRLHNEDARFFMYKLRWRCSVSLQTNITA